MAPQLRADLAHRYGDGYLPARAVWERYGVTAMSLWRWVADPDLSFPKPVYFGRFRYWKLSELGEWERTRPRVSPTKTEAA